MEAGEEAEDRHCGGLATGVAESCSTESLMGIYGKDIYDPYQGVKNGDLYRAIDRSRSSFANMAEVEERTRSLDDVDLQYIAAERTAERCERVAKSYRALAITIKDEIDKKPVEW